MRTKEVWLMMPLFSHTLPKHPIIFLIQCLIYFHMFLRHVFVLHKESEEKLETR